MDKMSTVEPSGRGNTLPGPEALKQDKVTYRSQEMWLEAAGPLAAILEGASKGT